jgi:hypothetical protein
MQKRVTILFSALILLQSLNISMQDIAKFGVLIEHANYHQETYGDSFFEFIVEHYGSLDYQDGVEHDEHDDLPFKQSHQTSTHVNSVFVLNDFSFSLDDAKFVEVPSNFLYKESYSLLVKPSVFQPPKTA